MSDLKRLMAKTNLKLAKLWLDRAEYGRMDKVGSPIARNITPIQFSLQVLRQLYSATMTQGSEGPEQDQSRGTQLLEIYALEIQMHNATKNIRKLKV